MVPGLYTSTVRGGVEKERRKRGERGEGKRKNIFQGEYCLLHANKSVSGLSNNPLIVSKNVKKKKKKKRKEKRIEKE